MLPSPQVEPIFQVMTGRSLLPPATALAFAASIMPLSAALPQPDKPRVAAPTAPQSRPAINLLIFIFLASLFFSSIENAVLRTFANKLLVHKE